MKNNNKETSAKKTTLNVVDKEKIVKIEKMMNYIMLKKSSATNTDKVNKQNGNS